MKKIIIFISIGVILFAFGVVFSLTPRDKKAILNSAIYISDGKLDRANEGKFVILAGRLNADLPFIDPETKVKIPYLTARRTVYSFEKKPNKEG